MIEPASCQPKVKAAAQKSVHDLVMRCQQMLNMPPAITAARILLQKSLFLTFLLIAFHPFSFLFIFLVLVLFTDVAVKLFCL